MAPVALVLICYFPALHGGFVWDDDVYVSANPLLTAPDGLSRIWFSGDAPSQYFPLTYTTFWIERRLWGLDTTGYHAVNILLHAANGLLLWRLLRRLGIPGALLAATLFAVHPLNVESVAWISQRKNVLSGFFSLLATLGWLRAREPAAPGRRAAQTALAAVLLLAAMLSKTTAATLPAVWVVLDWHLAGRVSGRRFLQLLPLMILGLAMGLLTAWWERTHQGASGPLFQMPLTQRLEVAGRSFWFYVGKIVWPFGLSFIYPRWEPGAGWPAALPVAAAGGALLSLALLSRRIGRGPLAGLLGYTLSIAPLLGFIPMYTHRYFFTANHYAYVPAMGLLAAIAAALARSAGAGERRTTRRVSAAAILVMLSLLTWRQARTFRDAETLWRDTLARAPSAWPASVNLGNLLLARAQSREALEVLQDALALRPDTAEVEHAMGRALANLNRQSEAAEHYRRAIEIGPPRAEYYNNLGLTLALQRKLDEAVQSFRQALAQDPEYLPAICNLALARKRSGDPATAVVLYHSALERNPDLPGIRVELAGAYLLLGKTALATRHLEDALERNPRDARAHEMLANLRSAAGQPDAAMDHLRAAADLDPRNPRLRYNLGRLLLASGNPAAALAEFRKAIEAQPDSPALLNDVAWMAATSPGLAAHASGMAVAWARRACALSGDQEPGFLDTLAAALAAEGEFDEAVRVADAASRLAVSRNLADLAQAISNRLARFAAGQPYIEPPPAVQ
jgi:Tfp pilus assembly protein PilF